MRVYIEKMDMLSWNLSYTKPEYFFQSYLDQSQIKAHTLIKGINDIKYWVHVI